MAETQKSTRQLLVKIPNVPCLYRHSLNGLYYATKRIRGKRKEHSLATKDRKIAEPKLKEWTAELDKVDAKAAKMTLEALLEKFQAVNKGRAAKTQATDQGLTILEEADTGTATGTATGKLENGSCGSFSAS